MIFNSIFRSIFGLKHKGERVAPNSGDVIILSPVIHIDARANHAEVRRLVSNAVQQGLDNLK